MKRQPETAEAYATRANRLLRFIADMRPTSLEGFAAILPERDMRTLRALDGSGFLMRCTDTGRYFVPSLCVLA